MAPGAWRVSLLLALTTLQSGQAFLSGGGKSLHMFPLLSTRTGSAFDGGVEAASVKAGAGALWCRGGSLEGLGDASGFFVGCAGSCPVKVPLVNGRSSPFSTYGQEAARSTCRLSAAGNDDEDRELSILEAEQVGHGGPGGAGGMHGV